MPWRVDSDTRSPSVHLEISCPSVGSVLSVYRESDVSVVSPIGTRRGEKGRNAEGRVLVNKREAEFDTLTGNEPEGVWGRACERFPLANAYRTIRERMPDRDEWVPFGLTRSIVLPIDDTPTVDTSEPEYCPATQMSKV